MCLFATKTTACKHVWYKSATFEYACRALVCKSTLHAFISCVLLFYPKQRAKRFTRDKCCQSHASPWGSAFWAHSAWLCTAGTSEYGTEFTKEPGTGFFSFQSQKREGRLNSLEEARKIMIRRKDETGIRSGSGMPGVGVLPSRLTSWHIHQINSISMNSPEGCGYDSYVVNDHLLDELTANRWRMRT